MQSPGHPNPSIVVDTDQSRLDVQTIHRFLTDSYWSRGIPFEVVERSIRGSLCFGLYDGDRQVGFARVISDCATFAYLADVFVLESHRGRGLGKVLISAVMAHPSLQGLRRWLLATRDAHDLYSQFGFTPLAVPGRFMGPPRPECSTPQKTQAKRGPPGGCGGGGGPEYQNTRGGGLARRINRKAPRKGPENLKKYRAGARESDTKRLPWSQVAKNEG